jgi:hypothetical protein
MLTASVLSSASSYTLESKTNWIIIFFTQVLPSRIDVGSRELYLLEPEAGAELGQPFLLHWVPLIVVPCSQPVTNFLFSLIYYIIYIFLSSADPFLLWFFLLVSSLHICLYILSKSAELAGSIIYVAYLHGAVRNC